MNPETNRLQRIRIIIIICATILLTILIGARLYYLQIAKQNEYRNKIIKQSIYTFG